MESIQKITAEKPKAGTTIKGFVIEIQEGVLSDFVSEKGLSKWQDDPNTPYWNVIVETEAKFKKERLIKKASFVTPNSALSKWIKAYEGFPEIGQEVVLVSDAEGNFNFL